VGRLSTETLGDLLRGYRTGAGLTQAALAEKAGLSEQAISMLERGSRKRPRTETLQAIAAALGLDAESAERLSSAARGSRRKLSSPSTPSADEVATVVPRQLPPTLSDFTGRTAELDDLVRALTPDRTFGAVSMVAVTGMGGVGKTALAVHAAHLTADNYPDGHLYLDLRGYGPGDPVTPADALSQLLRSLGIGGQSIPDGVDEAAALYRTRMAGLRVLVLLDNANGAAQVRPLLPGVPGSAVIVTSRRGLTALPGFFQVSLAPLSETDSVELLGLIAGEARVSAETPAAHSLAQLTGHLPLALRLIGARLAARPTWPIEHVVNQLQDERRRLDELGTGESGVRANIVGSVQFLAGSDQLLDQQAAAALDLLGLPNGSDLITLTTSHLLGEPEERTEQLLERLVDLNLLESIAPGRYRLHDLIRAYARERANHVLSEGARIDALARVLQLYIGIAWRCHQLTHKESRRLSMAGDSLRAALTFSNAGTMLEWLDNERANIVEAFQQARRSPALRRLLPELALALFGYHELRSRWAEMRVFDAVGREIASELGFGHLAAWLEHDLAIPDAEGGDLETSLTHLRSSLAMFQEISDLAGQARSCSSLSHVLELLGRLDEAVTWAEQALSLSQQIDDHTVEGISYLALGNLYNRRGDHSRAERSFNRALALAQASGNLRSLARRFQVAGESYQRAGLYDQAISSLDRSVEVFGQIYDGNAQSESLCNLAAIHLAKGDPTTATEHAETGLRLARTYGNKQREGQILIEQGKIAEATGHLAQAQSLWRHAVTILHTIAPREEAIAITLLRDHRPGEQT
jgi:tetratricopeptide (TPR) repeat protein/transcriptional regulator with XRE-family HTH domain